MATKDQSSTETVPSAQAPNKHHSQFEMFWKEFRQNTLSLVGSAIILTMLLTAVFAPFIAPQDPTTQFQAPEGEHNPMPMGTEMIVENNAGEEIGTMTAYLGTDHHGRDILSRIIYGMRTLMTVSLGVVLFAMGIGVSAGAIAGYYRNSWIDEIIMRFMDVLFSFPSLILAIAVLGVLGVGDTEYGSFVLPNILKVIIVIGVVYIPSFARVMRGSVLKEMEEDYVDAAKSLGASDKHILVKDIAVNTLPTVVVQGTLYMGTAVLASAALSFLGLGIQPPNSSLGLMLSNARGYLYSGEWWYSVFPGLVIVLTILGFNLLGDGLRDALDPRYSKEAEK
ncbi:MULTISPECIES: ABC transporter permease [Haloferax]|uniref:ABC transporter permease subunit n=2 Tax=Haloferax TaxID=2251 RepID=A0A6G1Z174_9EURY|nr:MULTISPECIES: ABC transporter permease [Haloferax]KAB1187490.1 ABC transporter permease [Haloferax sp. CBA1149]MRW80141.1 ABC transporter permease subunit [Haloferax marinisediminis]